MTERPPEERLGKANDLNNLFNRFSSQPYSLHSTHPHHCQWFSLSSLLSPKWTLWIRPTSICDKHPVLNCRRQESWRNYTGQHCWPWWYQPKGSEDLCFPAIFAPEWHLQPDSETGDGTWMVDNILCDDHMMMISYTVGRKSI